MSFIDSRALCTAQQKNKKIITHYVYVYNIDIRKLTIRMSVAIYMFRCLQSSSKKRTKRMKKEKKMRFIVDTACTSLALHGFKIYTEHCTHINTV